MRDSDNILLIAGMLRYLLRCINHQVDVPVVWFMSVCWPSPCRDLGLITVVSVDTG